MIQKIICILFHRRSYFTVAHKVGDVWVNKTWCDICVHRELLVVSQFEITGLLTGFSTGKAMANKDIRPFNLRHTAGAIARNYGDKGAVVITFGSEGTRIGVENLTPEELREALCTAIHYSFVFEGETVKEPDETG